jgi:hypothetical protein
MKYVKTDIPNGRTSHLLLTPRYDVSNLGLDYKWLEVHVLFNPENRHSVFEVREVEWIKRIAMFSFHGGPWLFPPAMAFELKDAQEHSMLVAIIQNLGDPGAYITTWGQTP